MGSSADVTGSGADRLVLLTEIIEHLPTAALVSDAGQETGRPRILRANAAAIELTGYTFDEMKGQSPRMFAAEPRAEFLALALEHFSAGRPYGSSTRQRRPDGTEYHVEWMMSPMSDSTGAVVLFLWLQRDVTRFVRAEHMRDTLFEAVNLSDDSVVISGPERIDFVNRGFLRMSGREWADVVGQPIEVLDVTRVDWDTLEDQPLLVDGHILTRALYRAPGRDGDIYLDMATTVVSDAGTGEERLVHVGKDVTAEILRRFDERSVAQHDPVTGLLNRRGGEARLTRALALTETGGTFSVVMGDLDHFKQVNDRHGHAAGDEVLARVGHALTRAVRADDSVIRWGGEEFLITLPGVGIDDAESLAERIRTLVSQSQVPQVGAVTISLGVAEWEAGEGLASVVSRADRALYASKRAGRDRVTRADPVHAAG